MTEYHTEKVKLSDSQLDKLKSLTKTMTKITLRLSLEMIDTIKNNFSHNLLLTNRQVASLHKAFVNNSSKDVKLTNIQISKIIQLDWFLGRLLGPLMKVTLPLMKNVLIPLAKNVLIPLGWTVAALADAGIHKKLLGSRTFGSGTSTLIKSNKKMKMKKSLLKILAYW